MREPLDWAASTRQVAQEMPLMMRFRMGKFCGRGLVPIGNSDRMQPLALICRARDRFSRG